MPGKHHTGPAVTVWQEATDLRTSYFAVTYHRDPEFGAALAAFEAEARPLVAAVRSQGERGDAFNRYLEAVDWFIGQWGIDRLRPVVQYGRWLCHLWLFMRSANSDAWPLDAFGSGPVRGPVPDFSDWDVDPTQPGWQDRIRNPGPEYRRPPRATANRVIAATAAAARDRGLVFPDARPELERDLWWLYPLAARHLRTRDVAAAWAERTGEDEGTVHERVKKAVQRVARDLGLDDTGLYSVR